MPIDDFIIGLYLRVDEVMKNEPCHPQAKLCPSEIVTLALLFALKGVSQRMFDRWLKANYHSWFPSLPERTRLFRLFAAHSDWANWFLAQPTLFGVADSYGIELIHPWRENRADLQIGRKGLSNHRWMVGMKLAYLVNQYGLVVAWDYDTANVSDTKFRTLISDFENDMVVLTDMGFHSKEGDPPNLKPCKRGTWNGRMVVETILSMLTSVCRIKKMSQRSWAGVGARIAYTMALFNILVQWNGFPVDADGNIRLSIAQFCL